MGLGMKDRVTTLLSFLEPYGLSMSGFISYANKNNPVTCRYHLS